MDAIRKHKRLGSIIVGLALLALILTSFLPYLSLLH